MGMWPAVIGAGASILGGLMGGGSDTVSQTTSTDWRTPAQKKDAERLWNDFINSFYGVTEPVSGAVAGVAGGGGYDLQSLRNVPVSSWPSDLAVAFGNHMNYLGYQGTADNANEFLQKYEDYLATGNLPSFEPNEMMKIVPSEYNPFEGISTGQAVNGVAGEGETTVKGYKQRLEEDIGYLKNLEEAYNVDLSGVSERFMEETMGAVSPYQDLLSKRMMEAETGTGMFAPVSFSFGGKPMASFVPKQSRALASQVLGMGREQMGVGTELAELAASETKDQLARDYETGTKYTPNQVENLYAQKLEELMWKMNKGQTSQTATADVPGPSAWSNILQGLNLGVDLYGKMYPWQQNTSGGGGTGSTQIGGFSPFTVNPNLRL